jgi:two-component system, NarL family, sensor kinase
VGAVKKQNRQGALSATQETQELRRRVEELEETLRAIRMGEVDAVLVSSAQGDQVFTLQGAEHPYRLLVETIEEGAATLSDDGTVLYSNKSFAAFFGVPLERFIGSALQSFLSGNDAEFLKTLILGAKMAVTRGEIRLQRKNGKPRTIRLTMSPNRELGLEAICAVATELTEIVDANEALRVTETSLRQLSARLLQLQDEERRRIARDLHDVTGQKIAVLSMSLDRLARLTEERKPEAKESLKESRDIVTQIGEEIRTLSYILHPPLLDECGLASAVHWYAEGFQKRSSIKLEVEVNEDLPRLPTDVETTLFRVVQESLTNVHRYSGSSAAKIRISKNFEEVRLEVIDYGHGIKSGAARAKLDGPVPLGVGIPGMRERLHQLGGGLSIDFGTTGTRVVATLPIKKSAEGEADEGSEGEESLSVTVRTTEDARQRILIADDHELMRRGLRGLLESHDEWAVCGEAVEGSEAVRKCTELKPDLVIMDVNLPGLTGIEAAQQIRAERGAAKILFFTVHDSDEIIREIVEVGALGYVAKSRASQDLVEAVRIVLGGKTFFPNPVAAAAGRR